MLIALCLVLVTALVACEGETAAPPKATLVPAEPTSVRTLLSEEAAASILRDFLIDCIASWDVIHEPRDLPTHLGGGEFERGGSVPTGEARDWWYNLALQHLSARYAGTTTAIWSGGQEIETWVVVGPGLERTVNGFHPTPGTWRIFAGRRVAEPLDGPARIALEGFMRPLDLKFDRDCSGYRES